MEEQRDIPRAHLGEGGNNHAEMGYGVSNPVQAGYSYNNAQPPSYAYNNYPTGTPGQQMYHQSNVVFSQPTAVVAPAMPPPDKMTSAILVTLCCFWPTGIVAIIKASEANSAYMSGDYARARSASSSASTMIKASIIIGIITFIVVGIIVGVYVGLVLNAVSEINDNGHSN